MCERNSRSGRRLTALAVGVALLAPAAALAQPPFPPPAPPAEGFLGGAETFAVLGATLVSNTGGSTFGGDVGSGPGGAVDGVTAAMLAEGSAIHEGDAVAAQALHSAGATYASLAGRTCPGGNLNPVLDGASLASGVYCFTADAALNGALTLTGNGPWIFQVAGALTVGPGASVATPTVDDATCGGSKVFWQVGDDDPSTPLTASSVAAGASFAGTLLARGDVSVGSGATIDGRVFSLGEDGTAGTVTVTAASITACSAGNPLPVAPAFKVTGGGGISVPNSPTVTDPDATGNGFANYGFNAHPGVEGGPVTGRFNYVNHVIAGNLHVNGPVTDIDVLALNEDGTPRTVRFSGTCDQFLPACTFSVMTEDNGEPPFNDQFGVTFVSNGQVVEARAMRRIRNGNIQFHSASLDTEVEDATLRRGEMLRVRARLRRDRTGARADAYVVVQMPGGQLMSWTGNALVPGLVPMVRNLVPVNFVGDIFAVRVPEGTPPGTYAVLSGLTEAGTMNMLSGIQRRTFTIQP